MIWAFEIGKSQAITDARVLSLSPEAAGVATFPPADTPGVPGSSLSDLAPDTYKVTESACSYY